MADPQVPNVRQSLRRHPRDSPAKILIGLSPALGLFDIVDVMHLAAATHVVINESVRDPCTVGSPAPGDHAFRNAPIAFANSTTRLIIVSIVGQISVKPS